MITARQHFFVLVSCAFCAWALLFAVWWSMSGESYPSFHAEVRGSAVGRHLQPLTGFTVAFWAFALFSLAATLQRLSLRAWILVLVSIGCASPVWLLLSLSEDLYPPFQTFPSLLDDHLIPLIMLLASFPAGYLVRRLRLRRHPEVVAWEKEIVHRRRPATGIDRARAKWDIVWFVVGSCPAIVILFFTPASEWLWGYRGQSTAIWAGSGAGVVGIVAFSDYIRISSNPSWSASTAEYRLRTLRLRTAQNLWLLGYISASLLTPIHVFFALTGILIGVMLYWSWEGQNRLRAVWMAQSAEAPEKARSRDPR